MSLASPKGGIESASCTCDACDACGGTTTGSMAQLQSPSDGALARLGDRLLSELTASGARSNDTVDELLTQALADFEEFLGHPYPTEALAALKPLLEGLFEGEYESPAAFLNAAESIGTAMAGAAGGTAMAGAAGGTAMAGAAGGGKDCESTTKAYVLFARDYEASGRKVPERTSPAFKEAFVHDPKLGGPRIPTEGHNRPGDGGAWSNLGHCFDNGNKCHDRHVIGSGELWQCVFVPGPLPSIDECICESRPYPEESPEPVKEPVPRRVPISPPITRPPIVSPGPNTPPLRPPPDHRPPPRILPPWWGPPETWNIVYVTLGTIVIVAFAKWLLGGKLAWTLATVVVGILSGIFGGGSQPPSRTTPQQTARVMGGAPALGPRTAPTA